MRWLEDVGEIRGDLARELRDHFQRWCSVEFLRVDIQAGAMEAEFHPPGTDLVRRSRHTVIDPRAKSTIVIDEPGRHVLFRTSFAKRITGPAPNHDLPLWLQPRGGGEFRKKATRPAPRRHHRPARGDGLSVQTDLHSMIVAFNESNFDARPNRGSMSTSDFKLSPNRGFRDHETSIGLKEGMKTGWKLEGRPGRSQPVGVELPSRDVMGTSTLERGPEDRTLLGACQKHAAPVKAPTPRFLRQAIPASERRPSKRNVFGMFVVGGPRHTGPTVTAAQIMRKALRIEPHNSRTAASQRRKGRRSHSPESDHDDKVGLHRQIVTSPRDDADSGVEEPTKRSLTFA